MTEEQKDALWKEIEETSKDLTKAEREHIFNFWRGYFLLSDEEQKRLKEMIIKDYERNNK